MARRNAQLFEVLGARRSGGVPRRRPERSPFAAGRSFLDWFSSRWPASRSGGGRRAPLDDPGIRSAMLIGGAAAMLAIGFLIGRWSSAGVVQADADALRRQAFHDPAAAGVAPGILGDAPRLTAAQEESQESPFCFVLHFAPGREDGRVGPAQLAAWLRQNGVPTARIRPATASGAAAWATVVYTADNLGVAEKEVLRRIAPPRELLERVGYRGDWSTKVRALATPYDAAQFRWPD